MQIRNEMEIEKANRERRDTCICKRREEKRMFLALHLPLHNPALRTEEAQLVGA